MDERSRTRLLAAIAIVVIAALAGLWYYLSPGCSAKIESCCMTTTRAYIRVSGGCSEMKVRILDQSGIVRAEAPVKEGLNYLKLDLPTEGEYIVELVVHGRVVDKTVANTDEAPAIVSAKARIDLSGRMTVSLTATGEHSCLLREVGKEYYVKEVDVVVEFSNGTTRNMTFQGRWPASGTIVEDIGIRGDQFVNVSKIYVYVKDSLDRTYEAQTFFPR